MIVETTTLFGLMPSSVAREVESVALASSENTARELPDAGRDMSRAMTAGEADGMLKGEKVTVAEMLIEMHALGVTNSVEVGVALGVGLGVDVGVGDGDGIGVDVGVDVTDGS